LGKGTTFTLWLPFWFFHTDQHNIRLWKNPFTR
jgi:hypothetical protein